nr:multicopper oxidase family protein [Terrimicrobiaceae bacterium]
RLFVRELPLVVNGRPARVMGIVQADGTLGYSPERDAGFSVEVVNQLNVPTCIHWHGLILPNAMDGVPFVTQDPIPPGGTWSYDFPLSQSGTYWMHSHYGLQEQFLNSAPLVIWTPEERAKADRQIVVLLSDFSFTPPTEILQGLLHPDAMADAAGDGMAGMNMASASTVAMAAQTWDDAAGRLVKSPVRRPPADVDVRYDALLANRRTWDDPEVITVSPGETVLLRMIAASSATNFYVDTGTLDAEILAVDGKAVEPVRGNFFQLAIAQRIDLRVVIPQAGGSWPVLGQGEGTKQLCGIVLRTADAKAEPLPREAILNAAALDNTQELRLRAAQPLAERPADRTLPAALGGSMRDYRWTINGRSYPNRDALQVRAGERVAVDFTNPTMMSHPMHLHGHDFQVVEIDGQPIAGALRDTVNVPPGAAMRIAFDADNPGLWAFHCHILYHLARGMFTIVGYDGAGEKFWQPEESAREIQTF